MEQKPPRRASPKPIAQALLDNSPWLPVQATLQSASAVKALSRGEATPDQQRFLLEWLVRECCKVYDMSYRPGSTEGERDTTFAEGRRFPGLQVLKLLYIDIDVIKRGEKTR